MTKKAYIRPEIETISTEYEQMLAASYEQVYSDDADTNAEALSRYFGFGEE